MSGRFRAQPQSVSWVATGRAFKTADRRYGAVRELGTRVALERDSTVVGTLGAPSGTAESCARHQQVERLHVEEKIAYDKQADRSTDFVAMIPWAGWSTRSDT